MSFILEALKKSEQERRSERVPDLRTIHQALPTASSHSDWRRWGVPALLVVNLLLMAAGWWWWQQAPSQSPTTDMPSSAAAPAESTAPLAGGAETHLRDAAPAVGAVIGAGVSAGGDSSRNAGGTSPASASSGAVSGFAAPTRQELSAPRSATVAPVAAQPVQPYAELAPSVRERLPAMTFSFHVYSANPDRRSIIINDRRLRQGDAVGNGVQLLEITQEGVILGMEQHRIYMPVLEQW